MLIDVGEHVLNIYLNLCFFVIVLLAVVSIIPWRFLGAVRFSRLLRWLLIPVLILAVTYETLMPSRFDIRMDLFLLVPMYVIVLVTGIFRWLADRKNNYQGQDNNS